MMMVNKKVKIVLDIPDDFVFIDDVNTICDILGIDKNENEYGSFFVKAGDGEYTSVYGLKGCIPYLDAVVDKIL